MKLNRHILITALAAFCLSAKLANAQGNLIANGSFENNGGSFSGWAFPGNNFSLGNQGSFTGVPITVPDGNVFAFYQGDISDTHSFAGLDTSINTSPGQNYILSFSAIAFDGTNSASASINGSLLPSLNFISTVPISEGSHDPSLYNTTWQNFSFAFQATSPLTEVTLKYSVQGIAIPDGAIYDYLYGAGGFDNISVTGAPEPSTMALLGASVVGWLACRKRARLKK
jgi:hypothetical protein